MAEPRRWALAAALCAVLLAAVACGEPPVDVSIPERQGEQAVLDLAEVLSDDLEPRLATIRAEDELDIVALTYETDQASVGEARRAAQEMVAAWQADIALVAVAEDGAFTGRGEGREDRRRFFGLEPADQFAVPRSLRERIVEQEVLPIAARDDWDGVFLHAARELAEALP